MGAAAIDGDAAITAGDTIAGRGGHLPHCAKIFAGTGER
jgi:hypothetical protein